MRSSFPLVLSLFLVTAAPAGAHDWQAMRAEYAAEFENARMMAGLDCFGLNVYVERQRWLTNERTKAQYNGMLWGRASVPPANAPAIPTYGYPARPR